MINKLKDLFERLFHKLKYCKYCKWYLKEWNSNNNVCAFTFETYMNEVGQTLLKTYGDIQQCETCGHVEHDGRDIRHQKCIVKNKDFLCSDFKKKWYIIYKIIDAKSKVKKDKKK